MNETWTAERTRTDEDGRELIIFSVFDQETQQTRTEERFKEALPLMFVTGGYPPMLGIIAAGSAMPWSFTRHKPTGNIYLKEQQ